MHTNKFNFLVLLMVLPQLFFGQTNSTKSLAHAWSFQTKAPIRGGAVLDETSIYFGNSAGLVYALNQKTGHLNWQFETAGGAIVSQPALAGESIFVSNRKAVYALNVYTGMLRWQFSMQPRKSAMYAGWKYYTAAPVVFGEKVFIGASDGYLYVLDRDKGTVQWKFKTGREITSTPLVTETAVYQPSNDGIVYVLDPETGALLWKFETEGASLELSNFGFDRKSIYTQPILKDNLLLFGTRDGRVYAVDIETQEEKWTFSYGPTWAMSCVLDGDQLFVGWSTNNMIAAINIQTGEKAWDFQAGAHNYSKGVVVKEDVFFGSADGNLYRLNKQTGESLETYSIGAEIYSAIAYGEETIFFGCDDGKLYALKAKEAPHLAVYQPTTFQGKEQYLAVNPQVAPYLVEKGFQQLESDEALAFVKARLEDRKPSVIVFAFPLIPKSLLGTDARKGLIRQYLESGGKIIWFGDIPNFYELDGEGNFKRSASTGSELLEVNFSDISESGNYYSKATQEGLNWGFPSWLKTTGTPIEVTANIIPLAFDEFDRVTAWRKAFSKHHGSGFVSFRSWAHNTSMKAQDLQLIYQLAMYGL